MNICQMQSFISIVIVVADCIMLALSLSQKHFRLVDRSSISFYREKSLLWNVLSQE